MLSLAGTFPGLFLRSPPATLAAAEETAALAKRTRFALAMLRGRQASYRLSAAKALSSASTRLHKRINAASKAQSAVESAQAGALAGAAAAAKGALKSAK